MTEIVRELKRTRKAVIHRVTLARYIRENRIPGVTTEIYRNACIERSETRTFLKRNIMRP